MHNKVDLFHVHYALELEHVTPALIETGTARVKNRLTTHQAAGSATATVALTQPGTSR
jgi:hypothetical protein